MRRLLAAMGLGMGLLSMSCYSTAYDGYYYDYGYYDPYWYGYDAAYAYSWADPYGTAYFYLTAPGEGGGNQIDVNTVAAGIAGAASAYYTPAGCANATASASTVTYNFVNCTGPVGLPALNGTLNLVVSQNTANQLVLTATSAGLQVGGATLIVDSVTTITQNAGTRQATIASHTRAPDRVDTRDANLTVTWVQGSGCVTVDGQDNSASASRTTTSTISNYQKCSGQCPTSGTISVVSGNNQVTATFDGSNTLNVVASNGAAQTYTLQCQ